MPVLGRLFSLNRRLQPLTAKPHLRSAPDVDSRSRLSGASCLASADRTGMAVDRHTCRKIATTRMTRHRSGSRCSIARSTRSSRLSGASPSKPNPANTVSSVVVTAPSSNPSWVRSSRWCSHRTLRRTRGRPATEVGFKRGRPPRPSTVTVTSSRNTPTPWAPVAHVRDGHLDLLACVCGQVDRPLRPALRGASGRVPLPRCLTRDSGRFACVVLVVPEERVQFVPAPRRSCHPVPCWV